MENHYINRMSEENSPSRNDPLLTNIVTEENVPETETDDRLGSDSPLKTIFKLSIGPFIAEIVGAGYSIIDSYWIAKACGENGMAAMSLTSLLDSLGRAFGMFMSVAASSQLAKLRGKKQTEHISQVFADLLRICVLLGTLVPVILLPCVKPMLKFFGAEGEVMRLGFTYIMPVLLGAIVSCMNLMFCGILQSEGRSFVYGVVQVSSFILNGALFDPLFMLVFKLGTMGAGLATICAEFIPMAVIAVMFFTGKFDTKMYRLDLVKKPSAHTWSAIKTGFTQFISHVCFNIPSFFSRKYVSECALSSGRYSENLAAYNVSMRVWCIPASYAVAVSIALLPSASYAIGANLPKRVLALTGWSAVLSTSWCSIAELVLILCGKPISMIFGNSESFITASAKMLRNTYLLCFTMGIEYIVMSLLQSMQQNWQSIVLSIITQFAPVPIFGSILFFTDESRDVFRLMYMYALNDAFAFIVSIGFLVWPVYQLRRGWKLPQK